MSTNEHKHVCHLCKIHFTRAANLQYHLRSHAGVKTNTCPVCHRSFNRRDDMKEHEKEVHKQLAPYRCRQQDDSGTVYGCDRRFKRKDGLKRHLSRQGGDACRAIVWDQYESPPSSMSIVLRHSGTDANAESTGQDGIMVLEEPYSSSLAQLSSLARTISSQSPEALASASANNTVKSFQPSTHTLYDWKLVVLNLSRATVALLKAQQCPPSLHHDLDLRLSLPLLQYHQDLNRGAQELIKHCDYGPLRLCVNALFVIAACQKDFGQMQFFTNFIECLHEQYERHPPPSGPSIGMWSFGGRHHLPLEHVEKWKSGRLDINSAVTWLGHDNSWFDIEYL